MVYTRPSTAWQDLPSNATPVTAAWLTGVDDVLAKLESIQADITMTADTPVLVPSGTPVNGQVFKVKALASGADRILTFEDAFRITTLITARAFSVPSGQVFVGEAEYSTLVSGWVLTKAFISTGAAVAPPAGGGTVLSAGADAALTTSQSFTRTATEPSNATITARAWTIVSGPLGAGTTIGSSAALSWAPGSTPAGSNDIRHPVFQEMAFELTSTAENSTTDWQSAYSYIEDIGDQRGYTAGLVGFCSGTGDMLQLVQLYETMRPGNPLSAYISGLQYCADIGYGSGASNAASSRLGTAFINAWKSEAANQPLFRKAQRDMRKSMYWDDALSNAIQDGVGPLGLAIHYDILVNHGPGDDSESYGGIVAAARASTSKPPSQGGNEAAYLNKLTDLREAVLEGWGDAQPDGRAPMHRALIATGNLALNTPFSWSVYSDNYTMSARPAIPNDSKIGTYVLRYTATGAGSDDVTVTVS